VKPATAGLRAASSPAGFCLYDGCAADGDCGPGLRCFPTGYSNENGPLCLKASCRTSADCKAGPGGACVEYRPLPAFCGIQLPLEVYCQYTNDLCRSPADCPPNPAWPSGSACVPDEDGHGTRCVRYDPPGTSPP
jgi:hypothetical protein